MSAARNPFRSECVTTLPFVPHGRTWEQLWHDLEVLNWRGAIVGPCGSGKTTLLETMLPHLEAQDFQAQMFRLDTHAGHLPLSFWRHNWQKTDAVLLDGAEQLSKVEWQTAKLCARRAGAFVLTAHRAGFLPTWLETTTTPALLLDLANRLGFEMSENKGKILFDVHNGDLRHCFLTLYDEFGRENL